MSVGLTCRELIDFLDDFVAGELAPEIAAQFETHLAACGECRDYLGTYRETIRLLGTLCPDADEPIPESVPDDLVRTILMLLRAP